VTRLEYVARTMWQSCQRATGKYEQWDRLPPETRDFWHQEAADMLDGLAKVEG
jgi:hypothetical protein